MRAPFSTGHPRVNFKSTDNLPQIKKKASLSFFRKRIFYFPRLFEPSLSLQSAFFRLNYSGKTVSYTPFKELFMKTFRTLQAIGVLLLGGCALTHYTDLDEPKQTDISISSNVPAELWSNGERIRETAKEHILTKTGIGEVVLRAPGYHDARILVYRNEAEIKNVWKIARCSLSTPSARWVRQPALPACLGAISSTSKQ